MYILERACHALEADSVSFLLAGNPITSKLILHKPQGQDADKDSHEPLKPQNIATSSSGFRRINRIIDKPKPVGTDLFADCVSSTLLEYCRTYTK